MSTNEKNNSGSEKGDWWDNYVEYAKEHDLIESTEIRGTLYWLVQHSQLNN